MPKKLLLVDDEPGNLALLVRALAPLGHEIIEARDGRSAVEMFEAHHPDLILLDLVMPGMGGLAVLTHIRSRPEGQYVPVIVLTAHGERERRLNGLAAGADDFLEKPADGPILRVRVSTLLQLKESRDALQAANEQLAMRNVTLERLQREQRELTAFIVHDLKNPLSAVWLNLDFARAEPGLRPEVNQSLEEAVEGARRLRTMIEDLLIVSRLEESDFPVKLEPTALSELLGDVAREYVRRAEQKKVKLLRSQPEGTCVKTDRALLQRVIENILDNSLRYTPENGRVRLATRVDDGVEISVSNTGPSIPLTERMRIFDKFARLEGTGVPRGNAGLGLYFCKRAVESLGGKIEVTETADWPTSFIVHLPQSARAA